MKKMSSKEGSVCEIDFDLGIKFQSVNSMHQCNAKVKFVSTSVMRFIQQTAFRLIIVGLFKTYV